MNESRLRHTLRHASLGIMALLRNDGSCVNHKRVARIWWQEVLKVPQGQPKRRRLWLKDRSCIRMRPERRNHVWSYDLAAERTRDGRPLRLLGEQKTPKCELPCFGVFFYRRGSPFDSA